MISVQQAKDIVHSVGLPSRIEQLSLLQASGKILAENMIAIADIPAFAQSSMDGYALQFNGGTKPLLITGKIQAGNRETQKLETGQAMRIFTGAPLPEGADTVIIQEKSEVENGYLILKDDQLTKGQFVRPKGAEVKKGEIAMTAGTYLSPAALGFLAGIGFAEVPVFATPSVTIILTGDELQTPGQSLSFGQVYDANSFQLTAALQKAGIHPIHIKHATDSFESVRNAISDALQESELVLITGGVSVGDYDLVVPAATECGIETLFHKIKQKPGKPLFFGRKNEKIVFGLPGNPSSALTCFYEYVLPLIDTWLRLPHSVKTIKAKVEHAYKKPAGLTHFVKVFYEDGKVSVLHAQESFRLHSFAQSNCLLVLPEESTGCEPGDMVTIHLLPV
ncbi:MAG: gephyrin-like molybdotransferase Glp [Bacteroidota bacterium]